MADQEEQKKEKMDPEWKRKWVEALRSGKYKQGRQCLRNTRDEYCCLGVLCDLVNPNGWNGQDTKPHIFGDGQDKFFLPSEVIETVGLHSDNPHISSEADKPLSRLNDGVKDGYGTILEEPKTFAEIADLIEQNL